MVSDSNRTQGEIISDGTENQITEVVVYSNQAYVKRQARIKAHQGLNQFLIQIQAHRVDRDSTQASVYGEGEILGVQYREVPIKDFTQSDIGDLVSQKEQLEHQRQILKNEKSVNGKQERFLDSVVGFAETDMPKKMKTQLPAPENLQAMLAFLGENLQQLSDKTIEIEHQIQELDKEIAVIDRKLKKLVRPRGATQKAIEVIFDSHKDQDLTIDVLYVTENAAWEPVYKVDVPLDLSRVDLTMFARIQQKTGENWKDVQLSVSNAMPLKGGALPDMESWYLSLPSRNVVFGVAGSDLSAATAIAAEAPVGQSPEVLQDLLEEEIDMGEEEAAAPEAEFVQAEQRELPLAFEYELPQRINLDSGGGETMLPLYTKIIQGKFFIHAVPKNDPLSYLAYLSSADSVLLAGRLNVHFGGRFVGGTALTEKRAGEDFLINLGVERGVKVRREKVTAKKSETFFGKVDRSSVVREMEYRIVMENLKAETVSIRLMDHIPVSETDRIQIKDVEFSPKPNTRDYQEREGVMLWDVELEPKAVKDIRIKFFVKHPKNNPPWGL